MAKKLAEEVTNVGFTAGTKQFSASGASGTEIYGGYFSEEYLNKLKGRKAAETYDEMRRSEAQIVMLLRSTISPMRSANWFIESAGEDEAQTKQKELIEHILFDMLPFKQKLSEIFTFIPFGHSIMEVVHKNVVNDPKYGSFTGLHDLGFRSQKTIEQWKFDDEGKLLEIHQIIQGDIGGRGVGKKVLSDFALIFTLEKEGSNLEGISALRSCYGPYFRKQLYLKLAAIGIEKYAVGTPIGTIPKGKENDKEQVAKFQAVLKAFTSHQSAYITRPEGWEIEVKQNTFDAETVKEMILFENQEMVNAFVANFLALGQGGNGGAYALGTDLSDFFLSTLKYFSDIVCEEINQRLIPALVQMNFGPQEKYPVLKCSGINDKAGKEFSEVVKNLLDAGAIAKDLKLEEFLRDQYKLPKKEEGAPLGDNKAQASALAGGAKPPEAVQVPADQPTPVPVKLAESSKDYKARFKSQQQELREYMSEQLGLIYSQLKNDLRYAYKSAPPNNKVSVVTKVEPKGLASYKAGIKGMLSEFAARSIDLARKDVPSKKNVQLASKGTFYDALPTYLKRLIDTQSYLIADSQVADLTKQVFFQFASSGMATEDIDQILFDVDGKVLPVIAGDSNKGFNLDVAAADAIAHIDNQSRTAFYFDPEVLEDIESFTFTNEDPTSDICQELNGQTFAANDPALDQYTPPMHHNCKSRLVPNLKGAKGNPKLSKEALSQKALDSITLCDYSPSFKLFTGA